MCDIVGMGRNLKPKLKVPKPPETPPPPKSPEDIPRWLLLVISITSEYLKTIRYAIAHANTEEKSVSFVMEYWKNVRSDLNALSKASSSAQKVLDLIKEKKELDELLTITEEGASARGIQLPDKGGEEG